MKCKLPVLFCLLLGFSACSGVSVTDSSLNNVENNLTALESALPEQCKTEDITAKFEGIRNEITTVRAGIEAELDVERASKIGWRTCFFVLLFAVVAFILQKIFL